jgi:hypothetical protein
MWRLRFPLSRLLAVVATIGCGLVAAGCTQSRGDFAQFPSPAATAAVTANPAGAPMTLAPAAHDPATVASVAPAVMVQEANVPAPAAGARRATVSPLEPQRPPAVATGFPNINQVPEQPKTKLLTPEEKAKVIAELEALAKSQGAALSKARKSADCADQNLKPAQRVASATGDGEC